MPEPSHRIAADPSHAIAPLARRIAPLGAHRTSMAPSHTPISLACDGKGVAHREDRTAAQAARAGRASVRESSSRGASAASSPLARMRLISAAPGSAGPQGPAASALSGPASLAPRPTRRPRRPHRLPRCPLLCLLSRFLGRRRRYDGRCLVSIRTSLAAASVAVKARPARTRKTRLAARLEPGRDAFDEAEVERLAELARDAPNRRRRV